MNKCYEDSLITNQINLWYNNIRLIYNHVNNCYILLYFDVAPLLIEGDKSYAI